MIANDTIAAISSAVGPSARMIVRLSGPQAWKLAQSLCPNAGLAPATARSTDLHLHCPAKSGALDLVGSALRTNFIARKKTVRSADPTAITRDEAGEWMIPITLYAFQSPRSYTGEDLIEFHIPGNPLLVRRLLDALIKGGARPAEPGEFTARAYFHGRLDLTEAEGVAATIAAHNEQELAAARKLLSGELALRLRPAMDLVAQTLALVEVGIDFTEEDVSFLTAPEITARIQQVNEMLHQIVDQSSRFERLAHEPRAVLLGRPNAGKSTLLNALAQKDRAVVSAEAGTTRDAVSAEIALARGWIQLVDVAGIERSTVAEVENQLHSPMSQITRQMHDHALREVETADLVVLVHDASSNDVPMKPTRSPHLVVYTKSDRVTRSNAEQPSALSVSAHSGKNLDVLRARLDELAFGTAPTEGNLALNARHLHAIAEARAALSRANDLISHGGELLALELRETLDALGSILGNVSPDDVLTRVFSAFCIGK